ncbi:MAG: c-type cytochrome biogenesis protein CcmI [Cellvibrionaceae bacterium]
MMVFGALCALMVVVAAVFVVWPSLRAKHEDGIDRQGLVLDLFNEHLAGLGQQKARGEIDDSQYQQLVHELEQSLLEDIPDDQVGSGRGGVALLIAAGVLLPLVAASFYWYRGAIEDVAIVEIRDAYFEQGAMATQAGEDSTPVALEALIDSLEARLEKRPDNTGNRYLLARSYMQQSQYMKAASQYIALIQQEEALSAETGQSRVSANVVGELAQAVFLAAGNRVTPEVIQLTEKALSIDPNETTSLGLAGIAAFEKQNYSEAISHWGRAVQLMGPASNAAMSLRAGMARAQELMAESAGSALSDGSGGASEDGEIASASLEVSVALAPGVDALPGDTVFVYARAWQGAKVPLAIARLTVSDLPALIRLDESMAMAPTMTISSAAKLEVIARISSSGDPVAKAGDWQVAAGPIVLAEQDKPVPLVVESQLP